MSVELASAYISLVPSAKGIGKSIAAELGGPLESAGKDAGEKASSSFGDKFSKGMKTAAAAGAAALAGAFAVGGGLFAVGKSIDEAFDTIRVGTGATGAALASLQDDFRAVAKSVPASFSDAGTAIADLNTRLGLSGPQLQEVSASMLNLTRITKSDLGTNIETLTRTMGDWGVSTEQIAGKMDELFRASQATGPSVDTLARLMTQFGGPMRQLGFDFETTAALLGKFEKEGVNTELVMGSMRIALGKMARDGEPAQQTLQRVTDEIKNAGDSSKANAIALELFGARAGPDMAAAIREGRFEVTDLVDTITNGSDTIAKASADTEDFGEKWTRVKNRVFLALEPIASRVFDGVGKAMDRLGPKVESLVSGGLERLSKWWRDNGPLIVAIGTRIGDIIADDIVPVLRGLATIIINDVIPAIVTVGKWLVDHQPILIGIGVAVGTLLVTAFAAWAIAMIPVIAEHLALAAAMIVAYAPIVAIAAAIGALVAGVIWAYQNVGWFHDAVDAVGRFLRDTLWPILQDIAGFVIDVFVEQFKIAAKIFNEVVLPAIRGVSDFVREKLIPAFQWIVDKAGEIIGWLKEHWPLLLAILTGPIGLAVLAIVKHWDSIKDGFTAVKDWIADRIEDIVGFFTALPGRLADVGKDLFGFIKESFRTAINFVIDGWNGLEFKIPGFGVGPVHFGGFTLGVPDIPRLHQGGIVPGPRGVEVPIIALGGEEVLTEDQQLSRGGVTVNLNATYTDPDPMEWVRRAEFLAGIG